MSWEKMINVVDSHAAGDPLRLVVSRIPGLYADNMFNKVDKLKQKFPEITGIAMQEPRGHKDMFGAVLTEPTCEEADFGLIFIDTENIYYGMCGHGTIAAATIVVETGMIKKQEPVTRVIFDTCPGMVEASVYVENGRVKKATIRNVPSFIYETDKVILIDNKQISVKIAYGGAHFILVRSEDLQKEISTSNVDFFKEKASMIRDSVGNDILLNSSAIKEIPNDINVFYYDNKEENYYKVLIILGSKQLARSPCGTGISALMAALYENGNLRINEDLIIESFLGTKFHASIVDTKKFEEYDAVIPEITSSAYITGFNKLVVDSFDELKNGFLI